MLDSLLDQGIDSDEYEIIVIDDDSTEEPVVRRVRQGRNARRRRNGLNDRRNALRRNTRISGITNSRNKVRRKQGIMGFPSRVESGYIFVTAMITCSDRSFPASSTLQKNITLNLLSEPSIPFLPLSFRRTPKGISSRYPKLKRASIFLRIPTSSTPSACGSLSSGALS